MRPQSPHALALEELLEAYNQRIAEDNAWLLAELATLQAQVSIDIPRGNAPDSRTSGTPGTEPAAELGPQPDVEGALGALEAVPPTASRPASAYTVACGVDSCPRMFANEHALRVHRGRKHSAIQKPAQVSEAAIPPAVREGHPAPASEPSGSVGRSGDPGPLNGHRSPAARDSYLCSRCSAAFPTRDALTAHQQQGHPPEIALRPVGRSAESMRVVTGVKLG